MVFFNKSGASIARIVGLLLLWLYMPCVTFSLQLGCVLWLAYSIYELYDRNVNDIDEHIPLNVTRNDVVLITGCDRGMGQAAAHKDGIQVMEMDLMTNESITALINGVRQFIGAVEGRRLHGIINNAGVGIVGELDWFTNEQLDRVFTVNLRGPAFLTKVLLPEIFKYKTRIVNVTGVNGVVPGPWMAAYCATKFGLEGFSDALRLELADHGVKVITVRPGDYSALALKVNGEQMEYCTQMWRAMDDQRRTFHSNKIDAFIKMVTPSRGIFTTFNFKGIQAVLVDTMLSKEPQVVYAEGETLFLLAYMLLTLMPRNISDKIIKFTNERNLRRLMF